MAQYTIRTLERELHGVELAGKALSRQLVQSLGVKHALKWYYHTPIQDFGNATPHAYVARHRDRGKARLTSKIYWLLTGQTD
jgi:hypothetical protein